MCKGESHHPDERARLEAVGDEPTADRLSQRLTVHEQTAWMLRSLLEQ